MLHMQDELTLSELTTKARALLQDQNLGQLELSRHQLEQQTLEKDFWEHSTAQAVMQELSSLTQLQQQFATVQQLLDDIQDLEHLIDETQQSDGDQAGFIEELNKQEHILRKLVSNLEYTQYLSGEYDKLGCVFSIHSGQGGTEAMDWAEMVRRMYERYFEKKEWSFQLISETRGEEAGIKQAEYEVKAPYAYGFLKHERGTHRLVRLSPFNADNLRQTSFALVEVLPLLPPTDDSIELKDEDLEWKFSRSSGAGGQNVNKVNTAVELHHTPSGVVVRCQEERSQSQNKERALHKLKRILAQKKADEQELKLQTEKGEHTQASWGTQIRNYVLHPYKLVKDTRTGVESTQAEQVLDGDLDAFIDAAVRL